MTLKSWTTKGGMKIYRVAGGRSNAFLVSNGAKCLLVDTSSRLMRRSLIRNLEKLDIHRIDYLVLTHSHFDHTGNAAYVKKKYGARVIIHKDEKIFLEEGRNPEIKGTNRFAARVAWLAERKSVPFTSFEPCRADILAGERLDLQESGINACLMHTPGHTPGSMSLVVDDEIAIVGDTMVGTFPGSIFPPFAQDVSRLTVSWDRLLKTGCRLFLPSHGTANKRDLVRRCFDARRT